MLKAGLKQAEGKIPSGRSGIGRANPLPMSKAAKYTKKNHGDKLPQVPCYGFISDLQELKCLTIYALNINPILFAL